MPPAVVAGARSPDRAGAATVGNAGNDATGTMAISGETRTENAGTTSSSRPLLAAEDVAFVAVLDRQAVDDFLGDVAGVTLPPADRAELPTSNALGANGVGRYGSPNGASASNV